MPKRIELWRAGAVLSLITLTYLLYYIAMRRDSYKPFVDEDVSNLTVVECVKAVSKSQQGEDVALFERLFAKHTRGGGYFIEVGALDGIQYSNTYVFEKCLDWSGLLIEPSPDNFHHLVLNRPRAQKLNLAACSLEDSSHSEGEIEFGDGRGAVAAAVDEVSQVYKNTWWKGEQHLVTVPCAPFSKYFALLGIRNVDLFSVDVEGAEFSLLKTVDFNAVNVHYVLVEAIAYDEADEEKLGKVRTLMEKENNFTRTRFDSINDLYENKQYERRKAANAKYRWLPSKGVFEE